MSNLPSPHGTLVKQINTLLYKFIWNSGADRIKRHTLCQSIENGGLKMTDLETQNMSLKISWVHRLSSLDNSHMLVQLLGQQIPRYHDLEGHLWQCNLEKKDIGVIFTSNFKSQLWLDIVSSWCEYNFFNPESYTEISQQLLWFNSHIRIQGKPIFYCHWYTKGVVTVNDIQNLDGTLLNYNEFCAKFDIKVNFLLYNGLIAAIPKGWKRVLQAENNNESEFVTKIEKIQKVSKPVKMVYWEKIQHRKVDVQNQVNKWNRDLNTNFTDIEFLAYYQLIYSCTISTKHRVFQYKLLHRILATNSWLHKVSILESGLCSFCNSSQETLIHLFWDCNVIQELWSHIFDWINAVTHRGRRYDNTVLLGNKDLFLNFLFILAKHYIYTCRTKTRKPIFNNYLQYVKHAHRLEKEIAEKNGKINSHNSKWNWFITWLQ